MKPALNARRIAIIPSYGGSVDGLTLLTDALIEVGLDPFVVPTSVSLQDQLRSSAVPWVQIGSNPGFGASIEAGLAAVCREWDWLYVFNDDIEINGAALAQTLADCERTADEFQLILLDETPPKAIPRTRETLLLVSLLMPLVQRFHLRLRREQRPTYRPFSAVAITNNLWSALGGFDPTLLYTFEDADMVARARKLGAIVQLPARTGVHHERHKTSSRHIAEVLPVAVWSAHAYLIALGASRGAATLSILAALVTRVPLALVSGTGRAAHLKGIWRAAVAIATRRPPSLPSFDRS